jgi:hypothetical protein
LPQLDQSAGHIGQADRHFAAALERVVDCAHGKGEQAEHDDLGPESPCRRPAQQHQRDHGGDGRLAPASGAQRNQRAAGDPAEECPDQERRRQCPAGRSAQRHAEPGGVPDMKETKYPFADRNPTASTKPANAASVTAKRRRARS